MPRGPCSSTLALLVFSVNVAFAAAVTEACPVKQCLDKKKAAAAPKSSPGFLEKRAVRRHGHGANGEEDVLDGALQSATEALNSAEEEETYDVKYRPGSFTCMYCDYKVCEGCAVLCETSQCIGEFYHEECWCRTDGSVKMNASVVQFDEDGKGHLADGVHKYLCDEDCTGGICDAQGLQCKKKAEVCTEPWWWCEEQTPLVNMLPKTVRDPKAKDDFSKLNFNESRFICEVGARPPKVRNPETLLWKDRGYLVLDVETCDGSGFDEDCFCWDEFLYKKGEDPKISSTKCDKSCSWGDCQGRTCKKEAPLYPTTTPEPTPAPPTLEPLTRASPGPPVVDLR